MSGRRIHMVEVWLKPDRAEGTIVLVFPSSPTSKNLVQLLREQEERREKRRRRQGA